MKSISNISELIKLYSLLHKKDEISENKVRSIVQTFLPDRCTAPLFSQQVEYFPQVDLMIVIPVYNVVDFLEQCIVSILNQKTRFSYVAIFVDDGSTDGSETILEKYKDNKNIVIIHQENRGLSSARNTGLKRILGEYVYFLDSDDFLTENAIEKLMSVAKKNKADIVEGGYFLHYMNGRNKLILHTEKKNIEKEALFGYSWGKVIRSSFFCNLCFPEGYLFEDTIMSMILYPECKNVSIISDPVCYYRQNPLGITQTANKKKENIDTFWLTKYCIEEADKRKILDFDWHSSIFFRQIKINYLRMREMPIEIKKSVFLMSCELYQKYFESVDNKRDTNYKWLIKILNNRSYYAYDYFMQRHGII